jgi:hypothetical protein
MSRNQAIRQKGKIFIRQSRKKSGSRSTELLAPARSCHIDPAKPSEMLTHGSQWTTYRGEEGFNMLTFIEPIYNEPTCSRAACHVHPPTSGYLAFLNRFSLAAVDKNMKDQTIHTTAYALIFMSIISVVLYVILRKFITETRINSRTPWEMLR